MIDTGRLTQEQHAAIEQLVAELQRERCSERVIAEHLNVIFAPHGVWTYREHGFGDPLNAFD